MLRLFTTVHTASPRVPFFILTFLKSCAFSCSLTRLSVSGPSFPSCVTLYSFRFSFHRILLLRLSLLLTHLKILCFPCILFSFSVAYVSAYCNIPFGLALLCPKAFLVSVIYVSLPPPYCSHPGAKQQSCLTSRFSQSWNLFCWLLPCLFLLAFLILTPVPFSSSPVSLFPTPEHSFITYVIFLFTVG